MFPFFRAAARPAQTAASQFVRQSSHRLQNFNRNAIEKTISAYFPGVEVTKTHTSINNVAQVTIKAKNYPYHNPPGINAVRYTCKLADNTMALTANIFPEGSQRQKRSIFVRRYMDGAILIRGSIQNHCNDYSYDIEGDKDSFSIAFTNNNPRVSFELDSKCFVYSYPQLHLSVKSQCADEFTYTTLLTAATNHLANGLETPNVEESSLYKQSQACNKYSTTFYCHDQELKISLAHSGDNPQAYHLFLSTLTRYLQQNLIRGLPIPESFDHPVEAEFENKVDLTLVSLQQIRALNKLYQEIRNKLEAQQPSLDTSLRLSM